MAIGNINSFLRELENYTENVYFSEIISSPLDNFLLSRKFHDSFARIYPQFEVNSQSFESYIIGKLITDSFLKFSEYYPDYEINQSKFIDMVYELKQYLLEDILLGPYNDSYLYPCNQGLRSIRMVSYLNLTSSKKFDECHWDSCLFDKKNINYPFIFGTSLLYFDISSNNFGNGKESFIYGINSAFDEINRSNDRKFILHVFNNSLDNVELNNTLDLIERYNVLGLIGNEFNVEVDKLIKNKKIINFGSLSRTLAIRKKNFSKYYLNLVTSVVDQICGILKYFLNNLKLTEIGFIFLEDDENNSGNFLDSVEYGTKFLNSFGRYPKFIYKISNDQNQYCSDYLNNKICDFSIISLTQGVIFLGDLKKFINLTIELFKRNSNIKIGVLNSELINYFINSLNSNFLNENLFVGTPLGLYDFSLNSIEFNSILNNIKISTKNLLNYDLFFEGYLNAKYLIDIIQNSNCGSNKFSDCILNYIYNISTYQIFNIKIGPFTDEQNEECNQGLRTVYILKFLNNSLIQDKNFVFSIPTCGIIFNTPNLWWIALIVIAIIFMPIILICCFCLILIIFIIERYNKFKSIKNTPRSGNVCIVFTDVQNSTFLWQKDPKLMRKSLKIHNILVRKAINLFQGYEVKTQVNFYFYFFNLINFYSG
jgi:hypothetical protein